MAPSSRNPTMLFLLLFISTVSAQRGSSCTTPNNERAQCISIYSCDILFRVVSTHDPQQISFLRESQCGYERDPLVCCGTLDNYSSRGVGNRGRVTRKPKPSTSNSNLFDKSRCGRQLTDKILDGQLTALDEFPWMVQLQYTTPVGGVKYSCAGSLINSRYVVTAAHCVTGQILQKIGRLTAVRLGEWNTDSDPDCVTQAGYEICNDPVLEYRLDETIVHPEYRDSSPHRYNDIALIRLSRDAPYTDYIRPICLPENGDESRPGDILTVAGWGRTEVNNSSPVKLKLKIPKYEKNACANRFRSAGINIGNSQICVGGERGRDSCTGDSGGPLMTTRRNDNSQWYLEGIVSFGARCGSENWPGIYTKVSEYKDWIISNIRT